MRNYRQPGNTVTLIAPAEVRSGDVVVVGNLVGIAAYDAAIGAEVETQLEGVFTLPKAAGEIQAGAVVTFAEGAAAVAGAGDLMVGVAIETAANEDTTVAVRLGGVNFAMPGGV